MLITRLFRLYQAFWLFLSFSNFFCYSQYHRRFWRNKNKNKKSADWKWWSFKWYMNTKLIGLTYNNNLDILTFRFASDPSVVLYSIPTSRLLEQMANSEVSTLYDRKNQTNLYNFWWVKQVHALLLFISCRPTFAGYTLVIDMLALSASLIYLIVVSSKSSMKKRAGDVEKGLRVKALMSRANTFWSQWSKMKNIYIVLL